jgi:hypothetical protein
LEKYLLIVCQAGAKLTIKLKHNNQRVENIADDIAEQFAIDWESQGTANLRFALTNLSAEFFQNFSDLAVWLRPCSQILREQKHRLGALVGVVARKHDQVAMKLQKNLIPRVFGDVAQSTKHPAAHKMLTMTKSHMVIVWNSK